MGEDHEDTKGNFLYEEREDNLISPEDGKTSFRVARFLKPTVKELTEASHIPNTPLLSDVFPSDRKTWPLRVYFGGWKDPIKNWEKWVQKLIVPYASRWMEADILYGILSSLHVFPRYPEIVLGLAEFWCSSTNTFVFPWGEASITLEDVMVLAGVPVLGEPVTTPVTGNSLYLLEQLEKAPTEIRRENPSASYKTWMKHFMAVSGEIEHVAFLAMWLSRFVFPNFNQRKIGEHVFPVAVHLAQGTRIAMAPAVLASLYHNLSWLTREVISSADLDQDIYLGGSLQIVQLWACERFPELGAEYAKPLPGLGYPRVAKWDRVNLKVRGLSQVRSIIRSSLHAFIWRPYNINLKNWESVLNYPEKGQFLAEHAHMEEEFECFLHCIRVGELTGIDLIEKYQPHRVAMQFGFDQDLPGPFGICNSSMDNFWFYVPSRTFKAGWSERYYNWWMEGLSTRGGVISRVIEPSKREFEPARKGLARARKN